MNLEIIPVTDRDAWLRERVKDVTSTEVSALYGLSPYMTAFELYHQKKNQAVVQIDPNERMKWGTRLESAIAHGAAEDMGWNIEPMNVYIRDADARIGSSFDFKITSSSDGPGILEVKNVDWLQYRDKWIDDGAGNIEAPEHIELQVQHQMEVTGIAWAAIVVLVGGNEQKIVLRNRDKDVGANIRTKVAEFWQTIEAGRAPSPDYVADAQFIIKSLANKAEAGLVAQSDEALDELIEQYAFLSRSIDEQEALKQATKAQILQRIGTASKVISPLGSISCGNVKGRSGTLITADMVGTTIGATEGYRGFRFYPKKEK
jgi:putative phage-type endonuclease